MIRWLKFAVLAIIALAALAGLALVLADTGWGHRQIVAQIEAQKPRSGLRIGIERIDGSIYGKAQIKGLTLSDPKGLFLTAPEADLEWRPIAWFSNRLDVRSLVAKDANLLRLPKFLPSPEKKPILPDFEIAIGKFEVARLSIAKGIAGEARVGRVAGSLIAREGRALIDLKADADRGDQLTLKLDAEPDGNRFDLAARLDAPAGGVFGKMLGTAKPVALRVAGDGSWTAWRGAGQAQVSGTQIADLALNADAGRFGVSGFLALSSITKGKLQRLTAPITRVQGTATLERRRLNGTLNLGSQALTVRASGVIDLATNAFDGVGIDALLLKPPALFPNMTGADVRLKARLNGPFGSAAFDYLLTAPRMAFNTTGFEQVRASGQGRLSKAPVQVPVRLSAACVTGVGDVAGGILANLKAEGMLLVTRKALTGDGIRFTSDKLSGKLTLFVDLITGRYDVGLAGQLIRYVIPGLGVVDVKTELKVIPGPDGKARVAGVGEAWVRRLDNGFFSGLAGGLPYLKTGLARGPDGVLQLSNLRLTAPDITLTGNGMRRRNGSFFIEGAGTQRRYGPFRMMLDGRIERPKLDLRFDRPADALGLSGVHLMLDPDATGFVWKAEGQSMLGAFAGNGRLLLAQRERAIIDITELRASGMRGTGRLVSLPGGFDGRMTLAGGGVSGTLDFAPRGSVQAIEAHLTARDARFDGPPVLSARRGQFDGTILLGPSGTTIDGTVTGQGLVRGNIALARLAANVRLKNGAGEIKASFAGSRGRSFDLQTVTEVTPNQWRVVGSGTIDRRPVSLAAPALVTYEAGGWRLAPAEISFAGGKARVAGLFGGAGSELDATLSAMPLAILDIASPGLGLGGVANGTVAYRLPSTGQPSGKADLRIKGLTRADLRIKGLTRAGLVLSSQPIDMGLAATLNGGTAGVRAIAVAGGREIGRGQAQLTPSGAGGLIERLSNGSLRAQLRYSGSADALWRLSGTETLDISGPVSLAADFSGAVKDPAIKGSLRTTNARIESPATGMILTNVAASGRFDGSRLSIPSMTASTPGGGKVSGSGTFDLSSARGFAINLALQADNARLLARDDIGATVTGPVRIVSDGTQGVISGDVTLNRSAFRLGRTQAAQALPQLKVREINGRADEASPVRRTMPWRLALKASAPDRLLVTGLGLSSEWRADLEIGGTPFAPVLRGKAEMIRGDYEFAGREFKVARGTIRFQGENPPDPAIDIVAEGDTQGVNATIRVGGTGQRPEIRFASVPALPEDELLSRLLFGTSITNLSAPEAIQLATAVASLRTGGDGLNPINLLRKAIGLDRLRILPADTVTGQGTSVAAGKYLTRRLYVEVVTDGQGYSATRAEFQITRWLSLLSTVSTIGRQSGTVRVSRDY